MSNKIFKRIIDFPAEKSCFLFGPRGTGKSFLLRRQFENDIYIDLLESETYFRLIGSPEKLESYIPKGYSNAIIIGEIQKIPVHQAVCQVHEILR